MAIGHRADNTPLPSVHVETDPRIEAQEIGIDRCLKMGMHQLSTWFEIAYVYLKDLEPSEDSVLYNGSIV